MVVDNFLRYLEYSMKIGVVKFRSKVILGYCIVFLIKVYEIFFVN